MSDSKNLDLEAGDGPRRRRLARTEIEDLPPVDVIAKIVAIVDEEPIVQHGLPSWDDVKHSVEFLREAARELDGLELRDSDLYAILYTPVHSQYYERLVAKRKG